MVGGGGEGGEEEGNININIWNLLILSSGRRANKTDCLILTESKEFLKQNMTKPISKKLSHSVQLSHNQTARETPSGPTKAQASF